MMRLFGCVSKIPSGEAVAKASGGSTLLLKGLEAEIVQNVQNEIGNPSRFRSLQIDSRTGNLMTKSALLSCWTHSRLPPSQPSVLL